MWICQIDHHTLHNNNKQWYLVFRHVLTTLFKLTEFGTQYTSPNLVTLNKCDTCWKKYILPLNNKCVSVIYVDDNTPSHILFRDTSFFLTGYCIDNLIVGLISAFRLYSKLITFNWHDYFILIGLIVSQNIVN